MFNYTQFTNDLIKAMTHKYVRRIPKGVTKTGATKYVYYYAGQEGHSKGIAHESEIVQGASFAFGEHGKTRYHAHISKVDGDKVTVKYDDGDKKGTEETMTKKQFQALVHGEHKESIKQAKEKAEKQLKDFQAGKEKGVKVKQETLDKLAQRVKNLDELSKPVEAPKEKKKKSSLNPSYRVLNEQPISETFKLFKSVANDTRSERTSSILIYPKDDKIMATNGRFAVISKIPDTMKLSSDVSTVSRISRSKITEMQRSGDDIAQVSMTNGTAENFQKDGENLLDLIMDKVNETKQNPITVDLTDSILRNILRNQVESLNKDALDTTLFSFEQTRSGRISIYLTNAKDENMDKNKKFLSNLDSKGTPTESSERFLAHINARDLAAALPYTKNIELSQADQVFSLESQYAVMNGHDDNSLFLLKGWM
jgi:hypothetical protein